MTETASTLHSRGHWLGASCAILLLATLLRFNGLNWDGGIGAHPDERYVLSVAEGLSWPNRLTPFAVDIHYAYGHLPVYVAAGLHRLNGGANVFVPVRAVGALLELGCVALAGALGRRIRSDGVGLLTMLCVALALLHVQQSHFYTPDVFAEFFSLATLCSAVGLIRRPRFLTATISGACLGLALGSKLTTGLLALPTSIVLGMLPRGLRLRVTLVVALAAIVAFVSTNPFAVWCFPTYWRNIAQQAAIARGAIDVPYTRQFHGTLPYWYPFEQLLRWGMGTLLGVTSAVGLIYTFWLALLGRLEPHEWVLLSWVVPGYALLGGLYAKYPRYLLPLSPILCLYAARFLLAAPTLGPLGGGPSRTRVAKRWQRLAVAVLLAELGVRALAFFSMFRTPHPWLATSAYLQEAAPPGSTVAVEEWDHPLPLHAEEIDLQVLPIFDEDTPHKWTRIAEMLAQAEFVVLASHRGYGALTRWPERYALTARYYALLFGGRLGFQPVACFRRTPRLGRWVAFVDDPTALTGLTLPNSCRVQAYLTWPLGRLDESTSVYDHPIAIVFQRVGQGPSAEELQQNIMGLRR